MKSYWLESEEIAKTNDLQANGIEYEKLDINNYQGDLDRIKQSHHYITQDIVEITPQTPNLETILAKFDKEHLHTDDEVRFVLAGSGIFDIRSTNDKWLRIEVGVGDFISVPKNRYHRFFCTDQNFIRCVRLFKDNSGWTPLYRTVQETATA